MQQLTDIANSIIDFINNIAVPLIFAVAFIVFIFGVFRYYILGADNIEKRKNGTQLIMYSIIGFVVMMVVWGLVNLVAHTFNFANNTRPDLPTFGTPSGTTPASHTVTPTSASDKTTKTNTQLPTNILPPGYTDSPQPTQGFSGPPS